MSKTISIVVPVYNEQDSIKPFLSRMEKVMEGLDYDYEIIFSMDPSTDDTYSVIKEEMERNKKIKLILFSRRFGQPASVIAGIENCKGDACVIIDVDLQDPPEVVPELVENWEKGYDVVYAKRTSREGETWIKKTIAAVGYRVINKISSVNIPIDTGDFRLIGRKVIDEISKSTEHHGFLKGMVPFVGFKQKAVLYHRESREEGTGKYNRFFGSTRIGFNGIFCYSSKPLEYVTYLGIIMSAIGALSVLISGIKDICSRTKKEAGKGYVSYLLLFAGIIVLCIGIAGEYISRIYEEVTNRPLYIIDEFSDNSEK